MPVVICIPALGLANGNAGSKETDPLFISRVQIAD